MKLNLNFLFKYRYHQHDAITQQDPTVCSNEDIPIPTPKHIEYLR